MSAANEQNFQPPPPPSLHDLPAAPRPTKLRPYAIGFLVIGAIILGGGIAKLIPGGIGTGAALGFFGILLLIYSFIRLPAIPDAEPPLSFFDKVTGIFFEPSRVFRNLRAHPSWVGAFVIVVVLSAVYWLAFVQRITPERIVDHMTAKIAELGPPFAPPPERIEQMKTTQLSQLKNPVEKVGAVIRIAVGLFVQASIAAALCLLLVLVFGGRINFWQSLSVVFYAWLPVVAIQKILGLVILYLKSPDDLHPILNQETSLQDNLSILFSPSTHPVLFVLASFIGLTWFYFVWLRAKGLHYGGTKVSSGAGWGVSISVYLVLLIFVTIWTSLFSGFIS
ncbi:MAG TPA: YIP1 family protein [Pyrinomonadaceae bacterium]